jgi:peptide deformylase
MNDILVFDTKENLMAEEVPVALPLYGDDFHMLKEVMPDYGDSLPNPYMLDLVKRMKMTMRTYGGIGLSANQCGVRARVFIIGHDDFQLTCINPKIVDRSQNKVKDKEGCLSFPGMYLRVPREEWIVAEFTNEMGETKQVRLEGLTARCYIHELDHMNGIRFVDHVGSVSIRLAKQKQEKILKKYQRQFKYK